MAHRPKTTSSNQLLLSLLLALASLSFASGQDSEDDFASRMADEVVAEQPAERARSDVSPGDSAAARVNLLELVWTARWLMLPIIIMSVMVVAVAVERGLALRRSRVIPRQLVRELAECSSPPNSFDPRKAFRICTLFPSPAASVFQAMLLRFGRPHGEIERAVAETMQRESERLYRNVRTLNLAAAVTPLMGLLGTVWGMIEAFFATANLPVGANKAESLAEGIYTAPVTTAGGLVVAIPAAMLAHLFEGQIQKLFLDIHELVYNQLMPQVEGRENRPRPSRPAERPAPPVRATGDFTAFSKIIRSFGNVTTEISMAVEIKKGRCAALAQYDAADRRGVFVADFLPRRHSVRGRRTRNGGRVARGQ